MKSESCPTETISIRARRTKLSSLNNSYTCEKVVLKTFDESNVNDGTSFYTMTSVHDQRPMNKGLTRSSYDRMIAGVCGGIADFLGWNATAVRVLYLLFIIFSFGTAIIAYFILALVMPK